MISSAFSVQRYNGVAHRTRVGVICQPEFGDIATLAINVQGLDIAFHMDVVDLEMLRARIDEVLVQIEAHREAA